MGRSLRVLCVADPDSCEPVVSAFQDVKSEAGITIDTASTPAAGRDRIADGAVDCVVSTYRFPNTTGIDFLRAVRDVDPDLPFFLLVADGSEGIASDAISAGVSDYVRKDEVDYEHLAERVLDAADRYRTPSDNARSEADVGVSLKAIPEMAAVLERRGGEVVIADCNARLADRLGRSREELQGTALSTLVPDAVERYVKLDVDGESIAVANVEVLDSEGRADGDIPPKLVFDATTDSAGTVTFRTADGEALPLRFRTTPEVHVDDTVGVLATFVDDTERTELSDRVEFYRTMVNTIPDAIYALDEDMHYMFVNEGMAELTGYDRREIIGAHKSLVNSDSSVESGRSKRQHLKENDYEGMEVAVHDHVTADGERIPAEVRFRALPTNDAGTFWGTSGVVRDISDRLERERELERKNRRLEEFASVVSHDLRNPLTVIGGRVELARQAVTDEAVAEHLATVEDELEHMNAIIEDVLSLARHGQDVTDVDPVELETVAEEAWAGLGEGDETLRITETATIEANRLRFRRLLENLFRNAVEHAGDAVTIRVGILLDESDGAPTADEDRSPIGFYVEDDGTGIPDDQRDSVLEPGFTTAETGTGFGLAIVNTIAESHDWSVSVTEGTEGGARFEVTQVDQITVRDDRAIEADGD